VEKGDGIRVPFFSFDGMPAGTNIPILIQLPFSSGSDRAEGKRNGFGSCHLSRFPVEIPVLLLKGIFLDIVNRFKE